MSKIYERWDSESTKAFEAFAVYRDMGTSRTLEAVAKQLQKSITIMGRWSSAYNWAERTAAFDAYIDTQARKQVERDAIKRKVEMLQRHGMAGRLLQRKGAEYLTNHEMDKSADAINAVKTGVAMERAAEGLPEYLLEIVNADDNELARQYHALLAEIGSVGSGDESAGDADSATDAAPESPADATD